MRLIAFKPGPVVSSYCREPYDEDDPILACAGPEDPEGGPRELEDCDIAINRDITIPRSATGSGWNVGGVAGKADVWALLAHEVGHCIGFDHVYNPQSVLWETYGADTAAQAQAWRSLSTGDAESNNDKY